MKKLGIRSIVVKKHKPSSTKKVYEEGENFKAFINGLSRVARNHKKNLNFCPKY